MTLIDNCDVEKLIAAVQCRRPIYDNSAKEHGSRGLLEHLWNEIAEEMNAPVSKCKAKWQQLRNSFVRSYRGTSGYGKKRKKWYLHDALSFMEEHIQLHKLDDVIYSDDHGLEEYDAEDKTNVQTNFDESTNTDQPTSRPTSSSSFLYPPITFYQHANSSTLINNTNLHQKLHDDSHNHDDCETSSIPPPKLQPIMPQMQAIPPKYINIPTSNGILLSSIHQSSSHHTQQQLSSTTSSSATTLLQDENPLLNFCKGILPEFDRLSAERQRKFKTELLNCLNHHLDEQENDKILIETNIKNDKRKLSKDDELCKKFKSE